MTTRPESEPATVHLPDEADVVAPDGSDVRILAATSRGTMAHFRLAPGDVARAIAHATVEELWFVTAGRGRLWRDPPDEITALTPGTSISLPVGCRFQFRCDGAESLDIVDVTMPPWPGEDEAVETPGPWTPTVD